MCICALKPRHAPRPSRLLSMNSFTRCYTHLHPRTWAPLFPQITEEATGVRCVAQGQRLYCQPIVTTAGAGGLEDPAQRSSPPLGLQSALGPISQIPRTLSQALGQHFLPSPPLPRFGTPAALRLFPQASGAPRSWDSLLKDYLGLGLRH